MRHHYFPASLLISFLAFSNVSGNSCSADKSYILRIVFTGLVVDVNTTHVYASNYNGGPSQFWKFQCGSRPGTFYIVNNQTGDALDVDDGTISSDISQVTFNPKGATMYQEWYFNSNWSIVNSILNRRMFTNFVTVGTQLEIYGGSLNKNVDQFYLQEDIDFSMLSSF